MTQNTYLTGEDLDWLFETHINMKRPDWVKHIVMLGNEDAPTKLFLYDGPNVDNLVMTIELHN